MRPADTPERESELKSLPRHKFVTRVNGDDVEYLYADPLGMARTGLVVTGREVVSSHATEQRARRTAPDARRRLPLV